MTHNKLSRMDNNTGNFTSILKEESSILTALSVTFVVVIVLGIIGNTCTILPIKFKKDFQNATFTTISLLAFVDVVALCVRGIIVVNVFSRYKLISDFSLFRVVYIVTFLTFVCSCGHVVILARLRYKLLAFPIEGMIITSRNMIYQCFAVWIISIIIAVPYGFHMFLYQDEQFAGIIETIVGILVLICTIVPIIVFHLLKIQKLKENITRRRSTIRRMTKMIAVVCIVQIITVTQASVAIVYLTFADYSATSNFVKYITQLLVILSHVANSILFFYFNSCKRIVMIFLPRTKVKAHKNISNIEERRI